MLGLQAFAMPSCLYSQIYLGTHRPTSTSFLSLSWASGRPEPGSLFHLTPTAHYFSLASASICPPTSPMICFLLPAYWSTSTLPFTVSLHPSSIVFSVPHLLPDSWDTEDDLSWPLDSPTPGPGPWKWVRWCFRKLEELLKVRLQSMHQKGRSPVWMRA